MNPDRIYALSKLRMAETEERARHARMTAGRRAAPLWPLLRARLGRTDHRERNRRPSRAGLDGRDVVAGR